MTGAALAAIGAARSMSAFIAALSATNLEQRRSPGASGRKRQTLQSLGPFSKGTRQEGDRAMFHDVATCNISRPRFDGKPWFGPTTRAAFPARAGSAALERRLARILQWHRRRCDSRST